MMFYAIRIAILVWYTISHFQMTDIVDKNVYDLVTALFLVLIGFNIFTFIFTNWIYRKILCDQILVYQIA